MMKEVIKEMLKEILNVSQKVILVFLLILNHLQRQINAEQLITKGHHIPHLVTITQEDFNNEFMVQLRLKQIHVQQHRQFK